MQGLFRGYVVSGIGETLSMKLGGASEIYESEKHNCQATVHNNSGKL